MNEYRKGPDAPAFPCFEPQNDHPNNNNYTGITKSEYITAMLMSGWIQGTTDEKQIMAKIESCCEIADEIIKQCNKK